MTDTDNSNKTWLGSSLTEICKGQDRWNFTSTPINPSKYHHVLYELPVSLKEPAQPHYNRDPKHWDEDYVRMPYSSQSLFIVKENNEEIVKPRWEVICESLLKPINSIEDLEKAIYCYNNNLPKFTALQYFFTEVLEEEESEYFFTKLLPNIIQLALQLPDIIPGSIPLLKKYHSKSISLSQLQVACLLANAFLCTFIWRKESAETYPGINFIRLFSSNNRLKRQSCVMEKLKCIFHYFKRVTSKYPVGVMTFERKFVQRSTMPRWDNLENNLAKTKVHINSAGTIEDASGFLQVDFANKFIGGGVLGYGCVQEEIRFVICPELIIGRLFTEELGDGEALIITGIERFSNYSGYSDTFKWDGNYKDQTPFDNYGRRKTTLSVIDATRFNKPKDQFHCSTILRELNKAYVGFSCREKNNLSPVATGNWGCGAFKGDPKLKSLIQLMACSAANRDLVYYSFGDEELRDEFYNMYLFLANNGVTICQLWRYLCRFCAANLPQDKFYSFLQQCHFDMRSQPTMKQFLCFNNTQKRKTEGASGSTSKASTSSNNEEEEVKSKRIVKSDDDDEEKKEEIEEKKEVNSEEIINLINIMDGGGGSKEKCSSKKQSSLFEEIDKIHKDNKRDKESDATVVEMDVESVEEKPKTSFIEDKKRKITDYFSKMTNHVNSYL